MRLIISIVTMIVMWSVANKKGFNPWLWFLAAGIPGFIILLFMPSANAEGIDNEMRVKRQSRGNTVGGVLTTIAVIAIIGLLIFISTL